MVENLPTECYNNCMEQIINDALIHELDRWAKITGRSRDDLAQFAVASFIQDLQDADLVQQRLQQNNRRFSIDEIEQLIDVAH